jgi:hypothetical protein
MCRHPIPLHQPGARVGFRVGRQDEGVGIIFVVPEMGRPLVRDVLIEAEKVGEVEA